MLCAVLFTPLALLDPQATTGHSRNRIEGDTGQLAAAPASYQKEWVFMWTFVGLGFAWAGPVLPYHSGATYPSALSTQSCTEPEPDGSSALRSCWN